MHQIAPLTTSKCKKLSLWEGDTLSHTIPPPSLVRARSLRSLAGYFFTAPLKLNPGYATVNNIEAMILFKFVNIFVISSAECPKNRWGPACSMRCQCQNRGKCNRVNGDCSCGKGWMGRTCTEECNSTHYGAGCKKVWGITGIVLGVKIHFTLLIVNNSKSLKPIHLRFTQ